MRKLLIILILGMCASAQAQEPIYNQMRNNYQFRGIRVDSLLLIPKFNDTTAAAYLNGIPGALIRVDSSVYMRFNKWLKLNGGASTVDTTSLSARIDQRVKYTDTAVMLDPYLLEADTSSLSFRIDSRVKYTDTAAMLQVYLRKADTASMSNRINERVRYTDTATMLLPYLRKGDTISLSNRIDLKIDSLKKSGDSVYFKKSGTWYYSFRDSAGGGGNGRFGNDTATVVMAKVHNDAGSTLTNGEVVYLSTSGTNSDAPSVKRAINKSDSTSANTFGFVHGTIPAHDTGWVILSGKIEKLNTSAFANGDIIYLDSIAGKWTKSKPQAPYHLVYLGVVIKANPGNGSIFVKPVNGYEIEELHDVQINNRINNQIIAYSDTQKVWKNRNVWAVVDTSTWSARIDQRVRYSDTASMLSTYMDFGDTISLSNRINTKLNISDTSFLLRKADTSSLSNRINQRLLISDTSAFLRDGDSALYQAKFRSDTARTNTYTAIAGKQDRSIASYSIMANNTNATANMTAQTYRDAGLQTYTGAINWTGTTPPSGSSNHSYQWTQVGKLVTLRISLVYSVAGSALTQVTMALPSDCPTPQLPSGISGANAFINFGVGWLLTSNTTMLGTGTFQNACGFRVNGANNGYEIIINRGSGAYITVHAIINYFAQ